MKCLLPSHRQVHCWFVSSRTCCVKQVVVGRRCNLCPLGDNDVLSCVLLQWILQLTCVCVRSLQRGFSICTQSIVYRAWTERHCISLYPVHTHSSSFSSACPQGLAHRFLTSPSYTQNRLMYVNERRRISIETAVKCVQKLLVGRMFYSAAPSSWFSLVFVSPSLSCIHFIVLNQYFWERERERDKGSITGQIDCD